VLVKGDRRGLVVVDRFGSPHSLTRYVKGHSAKEIKAKLAALSPEQLPSVDQAKALMRQRAQAQEEWQREQQQEQEHERDRERDRERLAEFRRQKEKGLADKQAARRLEVQQAEQQLFTQQQAERLALHAAQKSESRGFLFRIRSAVADLIRLTPGLRSVLAHIQRKTHLDPKERHRLENKAAMRATNGRSSGAGGRLPGLRRGKAFVRRPRSANRGCASGEGAHGRAGAYGREQGHAGFLRRGPRSGPVEADGYRWGEFSRTFNDEAGFEEGPHDSGDDDDGLAPGQSTGFADDGGEDADGGPRHRRRRGNGYGYRKDPD
jgi:hypothetical protein